MKFKVLYVALLMLATAVLAFGVATYVKEDCNAGVDNTLPTVPEAPDNSLPAEPGAPDQGLPPGEPGAPDNSLPAVPPGEVDNTLPEAPPGEVDNSLPTTPPGVDNTLPDTGKPCPCSCAKPKTK